MAMKNHFEIQTTFVVALRFFESALKYKLICRTLVILGQRLSGYNLSQIDFLVSSGSQADPRDLDDIVLACTSDNLVIGLFFSKKYWHVLNYRWYAQTQYHPAHTDQLDFLN